MRLNRVRTALLVVVATVGAVALALASVGLAGSGPPANSSFSVEAQPSIISSLEEGVAWGTFTSAAGSGSATHVVISITLPPGFTLNVPHTSTGCSGPDVNGTVACDVGTVNAGKTVKRYVAFNAPAWQEGGTNGGTFTGKVTYDNGNTGGGSSGGGSANVISDSAPPITVVAAPDGNNDGGCTGTPKTTNVPLSSTNPVSTEITSGTPLASLGLPCTWAFVGETSTPKGTSKTPVSYFNFPPTEPGQPVKLVVSIYDMPVAFKDLKVLFDPEFNPGVNDVFDQTVGLAACTGPVDGTGFKTLGPNQTACLQNLVKDGKGAVATILAIGTGVDPGSGFG